MAYIWFGLIVLLASSLTSEAGRKFKKQRKCVKVAVPECGKFGYSRTKFPNPLTNISSQKETRNLTRFLPILAQLNCTKANVRGFLCSVYVPKCYLMSKQRVFPPCREFCQRSIGSCPTLAAIYGIQWPSALNCAKYPSENGDERCVITMKGKKPKLNKLSDVERCCRFGENVAAKNGTCSLENATKTMRKPKFLKDLSVCKAFVTKFEECCKKRAAKKLLQKKNKKDKKEQKRLERKQKKMEKKQKKMEKKQKKDQRKQKKDERKQKKKADRKQKKADRKLMKANRKQNRKDKKAGKGQ